MKHFYIEIVCSLLLVTAVVVGCQKDEKYNLESYPINKPTLTIADAEDNASEIVLSANYNSDGGLVVSSHVSRTYNFNFAASPQDAKVSFELLSTNIPKENIEMSTTEAILPAGFTDASVTVTLKDEDFSFAQSNYAAETYELGVKATVEGYNLATKLIESKVIIKKEAYVASCSLVGEEGNTAYFERTYSKKDGILNAEGIIYQFKAQLDKPARKDVRIRLETTGLEQQFKENVTISPSEIIIPAGKLYSEDVTWSITDNFLLQTQEKESHTLVVTASIESEDPVVAVDEKNNILTFNIEKTLCNMEFLAEKADTWSNLDKTGWEVTLPPNIRDDGNKLVDGNGGTSGGDVYTRGDIWFIVDMKSEKKIEGVGVDYYMNGGTPSSPRRVNILTSLDNETWISQGTIATPQEYNHYLRFIDPVNARYVKFSLLDLYNSYIDLTEIYVYGNSAGN